MGKEGKVMSVEIESLLTRRPEVRGGRPCIAGTRTTVHRVAVWYKMGLSPEEIAREYPNLPIAGIYAALAYYHANQAEVEAEIAAEQTEEEHIEAKWLRERNPQVA
jgi:uncharacterized protein (DUF433 family)